MAGQIWGLDDHCKTLRARNLSNLIRMCVQPLTQFTLHISVYEEAYAMDHSFNEKRDLEKLLEPQEEQKQERVRL